ncbi:MAG: cation diffusion facilitator family transporter [Acidimicrobiales bacterium]
MSASGGTRAIIAAFLANLAIACAKLVGFFVTSSASLLAEAVHSFADTGNQALLLLGGRRAKREATPLHPFGYGRERYFWAFVVALVLFTGGSLFAVYEGIDKIRHPHELESLGWAMGILGLAIVLEGYSLRTAIVESNAVRGTTSWSTFIRRSRSPELPVVLLEDLGAMVGLVIALSAILTAEVTGDAVWDGIGTLSIGVLLGVIAIVLAIEMKSLLIGEGAVADQRDRIVAAIAAAPEVVQLIHLRTLHLGPEELLVTAKVEYTSGLDVPALARTIDRTEIAIRDATDLSAVVYIEPDIRRTHGVSAGGPGEAHQ